MVLKSQRHKRLDIPRSTYYRWRSKLKREGFTGLQNKKPAPKKQWNAITPREEQEILDVAKNVGADGNPLVHISL